MWDADVRLAVRNHLSLQHEGDADTRIVEEMGIWNGSVRVDVAVINGELVGYEIKSARDTLARLPSQAAIYSAVFDRVCLVAAERHLEHALATVPEWWGIIVARPDSLAAVTLDPMRAGSINSAVDPLQLARLLWREEALAMLDSRDAARGFRSASREKLAARIGEVFEITDLARAVRRCLKDRQAWLGQPVSH